MRKFKLKYNAKIYNCFYATTGSDFEKIFTFLQKQETKSYGLDIETAKSESYLSHKQSGLIPALSYIRLIQIYDGTRAFIFDVGQYTRGRNIKNEESEATPEADKGWEKLKSFLNNKTNKFCSHYAIFEIKHLLHNGIEPFLHCSMILAQFLETSEFSPYEIDPYDDDAYKDLKYKTKGGFSLANLCLKYFNIDISKSMQKSDWNQENLTIDQLTYATLDSILTYDLTKLLVPKIVAKGMYKAYLLYRELQYPIADMELKGLKIDVKKHNLLIEQWTANKNKAEKICKEKFNITNLASTKQLSNWVQENITNKKILSRWDRNIKSGTYKFDKTTLKAISKYIPELTDLLEFKKNATLLSTFGVSLQEKINPATGRVHCSFSLAETRTGRLSSREPNLQNMPRDGGFKHIFVADKGSVLVCADFSQIEIRIAGELSQDPVIRKSYEEGVDLHKKIVAILKNKDISEVTKEERQLGKACNFGLQFGMGGKKLAFYAKASYGVDLTEKEALKAWEAYHTTYTVYSNWCNTQRDSANKLGFVRTKMGKIRKLAHNEIYTKAVNTPVQGTAAEVSYLSLVELRKLITYKNCIIINTVHDEIIVECPENKSKEIMALVKKAMTLGMLKLFPDATGIDDLVEVKTGYSWADAK